MEGASLSDFGGNWVSVKKEYITQEIYFIQQILKKQQTYIK